VASVLLKNGVHNAEDQIRKYGVLDKSFDFKILRSSHHPSKLDALQARMNESLVSSQSIMSNLASLLKHSKRSSLAIGH